MSLSSQIRESVSHYKLARKVVEQICQSNNLEVGTVWSALCTKDFDGLDRHFRREKRRNDPLSSVKKPRTAFSFFTQANRNDIQLKNPTLSFGAVSKIVGEQWKALDDTARGRYLTLETEDKSRYCTARQQVMDDMAVNGTATPAVAAAAAATEAPVAEAAATPVAGKKVRVQKTAAPAAVAAPVVAAASTTAAKPAKKSSKAAAAPAAPAVEVVPAPAVVAATEAKVAKKVAKVAAAAAPTPAAAVTTATPAKKVASAKKQ
jgi:hypothetical protein